jgi:hypothetical protein
LKWAAEVNLDGGMLQVRFTMSGTRTGRIEEEAKSCKGRRIDLSPTVAEALRVITSARGGGYGRV